MKIQPFSGAYESPTSSVIMISPLEVLCSSVDQAFSASTFEEFTRNEFNW